MKLSEFTTSDRYRWTRDRTMRTVILVNGQEVERVRVRDGVALSLQVLHDAMARANWRPGEYRTQGGNGWVTAYSGGRAIMSAHVAARSDARDYVSTAPAHTVNR